MSLEHSRASLGAAVFATVALTLCDPSRDGLRKEGRVSVTFGRAPLCSARASAGGGAALADDELEAGRQLERALVGTGAVDVESLCECPGRAAWRVDVRCAVLDDGGAALDCAAAAAAAALLATRVPQVTVDEEGGEVTVHSPEDKEPRALTLHHLPVCATFAVLPVDPSHSNSGGGIPAQAGGKAGAAGVSVDEMLLLDPSVEEEAAAAAGGATITVFVTKHGELCGLRQAGELGVPRDLVSRCVRIASARAGELSDAIREAAEEHAKAEVKRRVRRAADEVGEPQEPFVVGYVCAPGRAQSLRERGLLADCDAAQGPEGAPARAHAHAHGQAQGAGAGGGRSSDGGAGSVRFLALTEARRRGIPVALVLHKLSDFLHEETSDGAAAAVTAAARSLKSATRLRVAPSGSDGFYAVRGEVMEAIEAARAPQLDVLERVAVVLDRAALLDLLARGTNGSALPKGVRLPRWGHVRARVGDGAGSGVHVDAAAAIAAAEAAGVVGAGLQVCMVKPRVAAGAPGAHAISLVPASGPAGATARSSLSSLGVPPPAIVQECVLHSGVLHKVYCIGDATLHVRKGSLLNAAVRAIGKPLTFDSQIKAAPDSGAIERVGSSITSMTELCAIDVSHAEPSALPADEAKLRASADALRRALGLTLFGFDVLVEDGTGDHVVVDVNYWPSFSGADIGDEEMAKLFRRALIGAHMNRVE
eukprot:PRCOL_00003091-RA